MAYPSAVAIDYLFSIIKLSLTDIKKELLTDMRTFLGTGLS